MIYKMRKILFLSVFVLCIVSLVSCKRQRNNDIRHIIGSTLEISELSNERPKILVYIDSVGCASCRLNAEMIYWQLFSNANGLLIQKCDVVFLLYKMGRYGKNVVLDFNQSKIIMDSTNNYREKYNLPESPELQCFLLDQTNRVLLVGNPLYNQNIESLYKEVIGKF